MLISTVKITDRSTPVWKKIADRLEIAKRMYNKSGFRLQTGKDKLQTDDRKFCT